MASGNLFFAKLSVNTTARNITIPNNYRGLLWVTNSSNGGSGLYFLYSTGGGTVGVDAVRASSTITLTGSTNNLNLVASTGTLKCILVSIDTEISV